MTSVLSDDPPKKYGSLRSIFINYINSCKVVKRLHPQKMSINIAKYCFLFAFKGMRPTHFE